MQLQKIKIIIQYIKKNQEVRAKERLPVDGAAVGLIVGAAVTVGWTVGLPGSGVGRIVGANDVGLNVGGFGEGSAVGIAVGRADGANVG